MIDDPIAWLAEHESIVGFPMGCPDNRGTKHPLVAHDHERNFEMLVRLAALSLPPARLRASPDIVHMFVCPDGLESSAASAGYELVCDPSLPPDSVEL